jgi:hypothetical protein
LLADETRHTPKSTQFQKKSIREKKMAEEDLAEKYAARIGVDLYAAGDVYNYLAPPASQASRSASACSKHHIMGDGFESTGGLFFFSPPSDI